MLPPPAYDEVRSAEVIGALCLATDLGMGLPLEHGLRSTMIAMRLAERLGLDEDQSRQAFYGCLLFYVGCTADAETEAALFPPGALLRHFAPVMFGSSRETTLGILRALADPDSPAPLRLLQGVSPDAASRPVVRRPPRRDVRGRRDAVRRPRHAAWRP